MGNISTFGTFTMARLGIYVSQHALNVTGNNITNINTTGYTRQFLDQSSMYYGSADRYQNRFDIRANGGVMAQGVYQLRDQYLDIRYRNETTRVGEATQKLSGLQQLSDIFDEVAMGEDGDGVLEARLNDFIQQLENMSRPESSNKDDMDSIVRSAAEALVTQFHDYANQLATLKQNMTARFREEVTATNMLLTKIRDLNEEIRKSEVFGGSALTLRDERNLLIDDLAAQMGIHVTYETEDLGDGTQIEKLKITTSGEPSRTLIDGIYGAQLTILDENNYNLGLSQLTSSKGKLIPVQPNKTEKVLSGIELHSTEGKATVYDSLEKAQEMLEKLNGDTKYTLGGDGTIYRYRLVEREKPKGDPADPTEYEYLIERFEVLDFDKDGNPIEKGNGKTAFVETVYSRQTKLTDTELSGGLQAMREMMTEAGEYATANDIALRDDPVNSIYYDADAGTKRGIPYYEKALDTLARTFAEIMNKANIMQPEEIYQTDENGNLVVDTTSNPPHYVPRHGFEKFFDSDINGTMYEIEKDENGDPVLTDPDDPNSFKYVYETDENGNYVYPRDENGEFIYGTDDEGNPLYQKDAEGNTVYLTDENGEYVLKDPPVNPDDPDDPANRIPLPVPVVRMVIKDEYKDYMGWPLFSNNANGNDMTGITAANISVSAGWESGMHRILRSKDPEADEQSTLQDNLDHMLTLLMSEHDFKTNQEGGGVYFRGTFQEMFTDTISGTLAKDTNITTTMLSNYSVTAEELYIDRDAVMGVDLNDETMNMMQYQKAYSAACRLMTTFDSMLEKLINGMAI